MKKFLIIALAFALLTLAALPVLASDLDLQITSTAKEKMASEGMEWYVQPGTYQGY